MDVIRLGAYELAPSERTVRLNGFPVEIGTHAFDLVWVLAEKPGRLVIKAILLDRLWPRHVLDENNFAAHIASLRRILGAGAIRTVPGFGYRLEAPVSRNADVQGVGEALGSQRPEPCQPTPLDPPPACALALGVSA